MASITPLASWTRELRPSLLSVLVAWVVTVLSEMKRLEAICGLVSLKGGKSLRPAPGEGSPSSIARSGDSGAASSSCRRGGGFPAGPRRSAPRLRTSCLTLTRLFAALQLHEYVCQAACCLDLTFLNGTRLAKPGQAETAALRRRLTFTLGRACGDTRAWPLRWPVRPRRTLLLAAIVACR